MLIDAAACVCSACPLSRTDMNHDQKKLPHSHDERTDKRGLFATWRTKLHISLFSFVFFPWLYDYCWDSEIPRPLVAPRSGVISFVLLYD